MTRDIDGASLHPSTIRKMAQRAVPILDSCSRCGATAEDSDQHNFLQRHHPDYSNPENVIVLCQPCHIEVDMELGRWGGGRPTKVCPVCNAKFAHYSHSKVKCCSPACAKELSRQNSRKRWGPPKLTDEQRAEILESNLSRRKLARIYGVSKGTIDKVFWSPPRPSVVVGDLFNRLPPPAWDGPPRTFRVEHIYEQRGERIAFVVPTDGLSGFDDVPERTLLSQRGIWRRT